MNIKRCMGLMLVTLAFTIGFGIKDGNARKSYDKNKTPAPNFITLVIDDMGFSDLGVFGSEIPTPNIDQLSNDGVMLTNFYAAPTSTPSRGMLFTGKDHHSAGVGTMGSMMVDEQRGQPGYETRLSLDALPFPELLQKNGYHTMMTGKWDLGETPEHSPIKRGFSVTRAALLPGGSPHYSFPDGVPRRGPYNDNGKKIEKFPKMFYSTEYYTDMGIEMMKNRPQDRPFYLCVTYTAPHNPLHAPADVTAKYINVYAKGWDIIRKERFERQKRLGLWPETAKLPPRISGVAPWSAMTEKFQMLSAKKMAVYAAMVDVLDKNVGRLISHLKEAGEYENTVIFLYSDNGGGYETFYKPPEVIDNSYENIGNWNSNVGVDRGWAMVKNTPLNNLKNDSYEGGWHTAGMLHYPKSKVSGVRSSRISSIMDIAPTILEMAKIKYPDTYKGKPNTPMSGISMTDIFQGRLEYNPERELALELGGMIGVRKGDWKISQTLCNDGQPHLYNLKTDPFELRDLAKQNPGKLRELMNIYNKYAKDNGVLKIKACSPE